MDAILPVYVLTQGFQESTRELRQRHPKTIIWSVFTSFCIGTVFDVWSRELCEGTCESLHPSVGGLENGWTSYPDRDNMRSVG